MKVEEGRGLQVYIPLEFLLRGRRSGERSDAFRGGVVLGEGVEQALADAFGLGQFGGGGDMLGMVVVLVVIVLGGRLILVSDGGTEGLEAGQELLDALLELEKGLVGFLIWGLAAEGGVEVLLAEDRVVAGLAHPEADDGLEGCFL